MNIFYRFTLVLSIACFSLSAQPKLAVNNLDIDFGSVFSGGKKTGRIQLKNIGNDTLSILSVDPSCGCTTVKKPAEYLLPGKSDIVEIEFNSSGYHAGKTEKFIHITTNDPTSPTVTVRFTVLIKETLELTDRNFWMGEIPVQQPTTKTVAIKNISGKSVLIKNIIFSAPILQAKLESMTLHNEQTTPIHITYTPAKTGYGVEYIWLETNNSDQPRIEIRVPFIAKDDKK